MMKLIVFYVNILFLLVVVMFLSKNVSILCIGHWLNIINQSVEFIQIRGQKMSGRLHGVDMSQQLMN